MEAPQWAVTAALVGAQGLLGGQQQLLAVLAAACLPRVLPVLPLALSALQGLAQEPLAEVLSAGLLEYHAQHEQDAVGWLAQLV